MLNKFISICLLVTSASGLAQAEKATTAQDQYEMAVTIYNNNFALIKDSRKIRLDSGFNQLAWREVSATMQPETALLRNLTNPAGFHIKEQNYDVDLLTPQKLLERYVNKSISVIRTHPINGQETKENATVLATNGGVILQFADRIETGIPGRLSFPDVPQDLRDKPTLVVTFMNTLAGIQNLELSYLTAGLFWQADYVAELNEADSHLDLNGLFTLTNRSGTTYQKAKLQLVAGDINRIRQAMPATRKQLAVTAELTNMQTIEDEALFEYHLYTLPHLTTLIENQTKQVAFMAAASIPIKKEFLLQGENRYYTYTAQDNGINKASKISVVIEFQNKGKGLSIPLPKGIIRVYKKDTQGNVQFIGEHQIDHTPNKKSIRLELGHAFNLTASRTQTDFKKLDGETKNSKIFETAHKITLENSKKETVTVTVLEPIPGEWTILSESQPHEKISADTARWEITLPGKHKTSLSYRVRVKNTY